MSPAVNPPVARDGATSAPTAGNGSSSPRLLALDALRGFDILWIVGGREVIQAWNSASGTDLSRAIAAQTEHVEWNGFTAWDLIFPLFLFLAGVSTPFSFAKRLELGATRRDLALHCVRRGLVLVALGLVYNGLLLFDGNLRCASVLGRIGLAWMFAALIMLRFEARARAVWVAAILVGYWAALRFVPVPGFEAGNLAPGATLTDWLDREFLPGRLHREVRDPEGLFATLPAIATALLGGLAGEWLRAARRSAARRVTGLALAGVLAIALGWLLDDLAPVNKNLWSSSFVLVTAGWSALLLALFHWVIDVLGFTRWAIVFTVFGANAIAIYLTCRFVSFPALAELVFAPARAKLHPILFALLPLALEWTFLYVLYRRKLFLRV